MCIEECWTENGLYTLYEFFDLCCAIQYLTIQFSYTLYYAVLVIH